MLTKRLLLSLALAAPVLEPAVAWAQATAETAPRSRVAVVTEAGATSAEQDASRRLRAEMEAQGFEAFAIITIRGTSEGPSADVLILVDGEPVPLRIVASGLGAEGSPAGLAIVVVERLRASLFDLGRSTAQPRALPADVARWAGVTPGAPAAPAPPPRSTVDPPPPNTPPPFSPPSPAAAPDAARVSVWLGLGARSLLGYRGLPATVGPEATVAVELPHRFTVGVAASVPIGLSSVEGEGGTASTLHVLALASASRSFDVGSEIVAPRAGVLAGVHVLRAEGEGESGVSAGRSAVGAAFAGGLDLGLDVYATRSLRVLVDTSVIFVIPEPVVRIVEDDAARGGHPLFGLSLGLQVSP